jgi:hypothetical protein
MLITNTMEKELGHALLEIVNMTLPGETTTVLMRVHPDRAANALRTFGCKVRVDGSVLKVFYNGRVVFLRLGRGGLARSFPHDCDLTKE